LKVSTVLNGHRERVRKREGWVQGTRHKKKMSSRLIAIWKLIEILCYLWTPSGKRKEEWMGSVPSEVGGASSLFFDRRFLRKRKKERPSLEGNRESHLIKSLMFSFPLDFRSPLPPHRVTVIP
jgi:hypothetical protein